VRLRVRCWQCGRERAGRYDGWDGPNAREAFRGELRRAGWFLWSRNWRFCPACATSARLALGVIAEAGTAGGRG
jgi:hypothetical protein